MATAITLDVLPARLGDCLLVECLRPGTRPWRCLVDGGPTDCWPRLKARLLELPEDDRRLDLVVVTHIDADHIAGTLRFFGERDTVPGLEIGDVWFNGLPQLPEHETESGVRSVAQGEDLVALLSGVPLGDDAVARGVQPAEPVPWNRAFDGRAVMTAGQDQFTVLELDDGPTITLLSPTPKRLAILRSKWVDALQRLRGAEPEEEVEPAAPLPTLEGLDELAARPTTNDTSAPNGSSIAFLLEHRGASVLLTGDAFPNVLGAAVRGLATARGQDRLEVDAFKLPHHGSRANVTQTLAGLVRARQYAVSSNGDTYHHPDDEALARVVTQESGSTPELCFNYANERTRRWSDDALQQQWGFTTRYPAPGTDGIRLELPEGQP